MNLLDELTLEDLDQEQRELAECIGLEAYKKLTATYAGSCIYVRMPEQLTLKLRNAEIKNKFNGYNYGELAHEYNLTEISIRKIVSGELPRIRAAPLDEQTSFFDDTEI